MTELDDGPEDDPFAIAAMWWSVMTWGDPGVCLYAFGSTGKVQSEEHRANCLAYIKDRCVPHTASHDDPEREREELETLAEYIRTAPIEPMGDAT